MSVQQSVQVLGRGSSTHPALFLLDGRFWWSSSGDTGETLHLPHPTPTPLCHPACWREDEGSLSPPLAPGIQSEHALSIFLQPGKLTEAFKYFLQGMGYSKYSPTNCRQGTGSPGVSVICVT